MFLHYCDLRTVILKFEILTFVLLFNVLTLEMLYFYQAYGIPVISTIELPALSLYSDNNTAVSVINVERGLVPSALQSPPVEQRPFMKLNACEFWYQIPTIARYYVTHGNRIIIEPLCDNWDEILLYVYSNCLAAALFQRNLIPFHVSGVFIDNNEVLLFAAPSRTGKSTTALMLQQKGYELFTDDTALLTVENGICYAQASYPMARLWQNTFMQQTHYVEADKQCIYGEIDKYGFSFHNQFRTNQVKVAGIVFLETAGSDIEIKSLSPLQAMQQLGANVYRREWLAGMKKEALLFKQLTSVAHVLPAHQATRPNDRPTFTAFADAIEKNFFYSTSPNF